ncbi:nucleotidyltransferase [Bacillus sp. CGMCC 1.16607]|uniref:nucleotidyltransferase n=1 Tax=Bacillus sp. CGMCC 1.16607 TaxID=3351842 RepID=UPI003643CA29
MKALGVVVEYNPFHNGHLFHIETAKQKADPDVVIAVMSGNFLQRGEPALVNKWFRTEMALLGGVDIVIELPYRFATQKAETFAFGSVSILDSLRCETLCFGSEHGNIRSFHETRALIEHNNEKFQKSIKEHMKSGISYPKALEFAFFDLAPTTQMVDLSKPNNILGYHYVEAIDKLKSDMKPITIKRKNAEYHDEHFSSETIASATSIRKALFSNFSQDEIERFVPKSTKNLLLKYIQTYGTLHQWENYWPFLKYKIMNSSATDLTAIYEIEEGLENRFKTAAFHSRTFHEFMQTVKTKRYTWTRLQRACLHIFTNTKKTDMIKENEAPSYLRLLGMTEKGQKYLNMKKKEISLPLVTKVSSFQNNLDLTLDLKVSHLYSLGLSEPQQSMLLQSEYKQPPVIIKG